MDEALDVVKEISSCFGVRFVSTTIDALAPDLRLAQRSLTDEVPPA
jgi:hypothetical protein